MASRMAAPKMMMPDPKSTRPQLIRKALTEHLKAKGYLK